MSKENNLVKAISAISTGASDMLRALDHHGMVNVLSKGHKDALLRSLEKSKKEIEIALSRLKTKA